MGSRRSLPALFAAAGLVVGLAIGVAACGPSTTSPSSSPNGVLQVKGTERLWWNQAADSPDEIARLRFAALVDGTKSDLAGASCSASADASVYECSSRLPAMASGPHTLQIVAIDGVLESAPSTPPLSVVMVAGAASSAAATASAGAESGPGASFTTADGVTLGVETLAGGLNDATDVAPAPGGWVFVAERAGLIRAVRDGALQPDPVAALAGTADGGGELVALAVDPAFGENRFVYAVHTTKAPAGSGRPRDVRITRLREAGGALGDQVTLLSGIPGSAAQAEAALRFGPDGRLYAAIGSGGNEWAAGELTSFNGKLLRLNPDGTTPAGQAGATPVIADRVRRPGGMGWSKGGGVLWVCDRRDEGAERLTPLVLEDRPFRARTAAPYNLPAGFGIGGAAVYSASSVPEFEGNLFVGAEAGRYLLRLRFDPTDPLTVASTERLLVDRVGGIRAVATDADGAIYVATADTLFKVAPRKAGLGAAGVR